MTTMNSQLGVVDETTYGTPVTVSRFYEFRSEGVKLQQGRVESPAMRSGTRVLRSDRFEPYRIGAAGPVVIDVPTKGFGWWLKHMLGTVATGVVTDLNYTHTGTIGSLLGDYFTMQINRPFNPSGTSQAFTYEGCKIASWELSCDVDDVLQATFDIDAEDESTIIALASASYPADFRVFSFAGASMTLGGASVEVKNVAVSCDNGLDVERRYLRNSSLKKEPVENGFRQIEWSCTADFESLVQYNRFRDAARANTLGALVATFDGPIAHGGTTLPRVEITIPAARFDAVDFNVSGPDALMQDISGVGLFDGTNSAVTVTYRSTDVTP